MLDVSLSVITPISKNHIKFLPELAESVTELKSTHKTEWILCLDGFEEKRIGDIFEKADIVLKNTEKQGIAVSRNRCMAVSSGNMICPIDADDVIVPYGLVASAESIKYDESVGWCAYSSKDLVENRETTRIVGANTDRLWDKSECLSYFTDKINKKESAWFDVFRANCVVYLESALREAGGWSAMPILEDLDILFRVSRKWKGAQISDVGLLRRLHSEQTTKTEQYQTEKDIWTRFILSNNK